MGDNGLRVEDLQFGRRNGFVFVGVAREHGEELRQRLEKLGIGASLHPDPDGGDSVVHPRTNLGSDRLRDLLGDVGWPKRRAT